MIGTLVFPALALLFFVVPQRAVADSPLYATQAVISLSVFAVMANALFSFGLTIAESREKPWDPYLRTLPAPGIARVLAHVLSTGLLGLAAIIPVIVIGGLFTAAEASPPRILLGVIALGVSALPFMLIGIAIGYALPFKAAIAVIQIVMFSLAFLGDSSFPRFSSRTGSTPSRSSPRRARRVSSSSGPSRAARCRGGYGSAFCSGHR